MDRWRAGFFTCPTKRKATSFWDLMSVGRGALLEIDRDDCGDAAYGSAVVGAGIEGGGWRRAWSRAGSRSYTSSWKYTSPF